MKASVSPYLPTTWASEIIADFWSTDELLVTGRLPIVDSNLQPSRDAFLRYLSSVKSDFGQKDTGRPSPHIVFANAVSDGALVDFVREFGPFVAKALVEIEPQQPKGITRDELDGFEWRTAIGAIQDLATLQRERQLYASALTLLAELRRGESAADVTVIQKHISVIANGVSYWPEQWEAEKRWRASHSPAPVAWRFDTNRGDYLWQLEYDAYHRKPPRTPTIQELDAPEPEADYAAACETDDPSTWSVLLTKPYNAGHLVLCQLINAFDTEVQYFVGRAVECLPFDSLRFGVRPALYQILKHMYLGRVGTQVCRNDRCRQFFESKREGQLYCQEDCSQRHRQREYWTTRGSARRKKRSAKERSRKLKTATRGRRK